MRVIVPVAGLGKRLQPLTNVTPKVLLPVAGKPVLGHILDSIIDLDPSEVCLVVGHLGDQIGDWVRSEYDFPSEFVVQQQLLGLGFALHLALESNSDEPILVILGDTITDCDLPAMIASGENVLGVKAVEDPRRFGVAEMIDGKIASLVEKPDIPHGNMVLVGLYFISAVAELRSHLVRIVGENQRISGEIQFTSALQGMIQQGISFAPWEIDQWYDCGKPETLLQTNRRLLQKNSHIPDLENSKIIPPVWIAPDAVVTSSTVGPHVSIQSRAIVTDSVIGDSIICERAQISNCKLVESLIGCQVSLTGARGTRILAKSPAPEAIEND